MPRLKHPAQSLPLQRGDNWSSNLIMTKADAALLCQATTIIILQRTVILKFWLNMESY